MRIFKKILIGLLIIIPIVLFVCSFVLLSQEFYKTDQEITQELSIANVSNKIGHYQYAGDTLRYVRIGHSSDKRPVLLVIHGAPGSCSDFSSYWPMNSITDHYDVISIDRPGYGPYALAQRDVPIEEQAQIVYSMIKDIAADREVAILSHSYGGPVGAVLAAILDTLCLGHIMVAPVIDPHSEEMFWYSTIPNLWPFSIMASNAWRIAYLEKQSHFVQLKSLENSWHSIKSPTIHIHGTADWLASFDNVAFCKKQFDAGYYSAIVIEEGSHFILWDEEIKSIIVQQSVGLLMSQ